MITLDKSEASINICSQKQLGPHLRRIPETILFELMKIVPVRMKELKCGLDLKMDISEPGTFQRISGNKIPD